MSPFIPRLRRCWWPVLSGLRRLQIAAVRTQPFRVDGRLRHARRALQDHLAARLHAVALAAREGRFAVADDFGIGADGMPLPTAAAAVGDVELAAVVLAVLARPAAPQSAVRQRVGALADLDRRTAAGGSPIDTPLAFIAASTCARCAGGRFFRRSLMSGAFWPSIALSVRISQSPALIGGAFCAQAWLASASSVAASRAGRTGRRRIGISWRFRGGQMMTRLSGGADGHRTPVSGCVLPIYAVRVSGSKQRTSRRRNTSDRLRARSGWSRAGAAPCRAACCARRIRRWRDRHRSALAPDLEAEPAQVGRIGFERQRSRACMPRRLQIVDEAQHIGAVARAHQRLRARCLQVQGAGVIAAAAIGIGRAAGSRHGQWVFNRAPSPTSRRSGRSRSRD